MGHSRLVLGQLAFDLRATVPSQEIESYVGKMLPNLVCAHSKEWSSNGDVRTVLQQLLERPFDNVLGVASILPSGGLRDWHIVQLEALAADLAACFDVGHNNSSYAMHVWLFHLLGGEHASLKAPTGDRRANLSRAVGLLCSRYATAYRKTQTRLEKDVSQKRHAGGLEFATAELALVAHLSSRSMSLLSDVRDKLEAPDTARSIERTTVKRDLSGDMPETGTPKRAAPSPVPDAVVRSLPICHLLSDVCTFTSLQCPLDDLAVCTAHMQYIGQYYVVCESA